MSETRVFILADGKGTRWNNHLGIPKHLVEVAGEPLLARTVRLLKERGEHDIIISSHNEEYTAFAPTTGYRNNHFEIDKIFCTQPDWEVTRTNIFLLGDVFYTEEAIDKIFSEQTETITFFGREKGSELTGGRYGELFAVKVLPGGTSILEYACKLVKWQFVNGIISRCKLWELYRLTRATDLTAHVIKGGFVSIDDWTEDIDSPSDYERFIKRYEERTSN